MKLLYTLTLYVICAVSLNAQIVNLQPGYYISSSGDTTQAELSLEGEKLLALRLRVQTNTGLNTLTPEDVLGFGFPTKAQHFSVVRHHYVSETGEQVVVPRFALKLVEGPVSLFRLAQMGNEYFRRLSDIKNHAYYVQDDTGNFYKLERTEEQTEQQQFRVLEKYRGVLRYLFKEWPDVEARTRNLAFKDKSISKLVLDYNAFIAPDIEPVVVTKRARQLIVNATIMGAVPKTSPGYPVSSGFLLGAGIMSMDPSASNSVSVGIGGQYLRKSFSPLAVGNIEYGAESLSFIRVPIIIRSTLKRWRKNAIGLNFFAGMGSMRSTGSYLGAFQNNARILRYDYDELTMFAGIGPTFSFRRLEIHAHVEKPFVDGFTGEALRKAIGSFPTVFVGISYHLTD